MLRLRLGLVLVKAVGYYEYKQNIMPTLTTGRNRMFYFFFTTAYTRYLYYINYP